MSLESLAQVEKVTSSGKKTCQVCFCQNQLSLSELFLSSSGKLSKMYCLSCTGLVVKECWESLERSELQLEVLLWLTFKLHMAGWN